MLDDYPKTKLIGLSLIVIVVTLLIFILVYQNRVTDYLNKNWAEVRCNPWIMPLAGFADVAEGTDYMDKVNTNFNKCMNTTIQGTFGELLKPFLTLVGGILSGLKKISETLNSFREVISSIRTLFQAFIGNTVDKLSNSYVALIYLREKMKNIINRQVAIMEIIHQFLTALPFLFYSLSNGPIPRFINWLARYIGMLIFSLVICLLCSFGGFFVSLFACPVCALCFTEDSLIGVGKYKKVIKNVEIGDVLDEHTYVTGKIYLKYIEPYPYYVHKINNECKLTGSHCVKIDNKWMRMNELNITPEEYSGNLICLITNNHLIPTEEYIFKDYLETDDKDVIFKLMDTVENHLNNEDNSKNNNLGRHTTLQGFSDETIKKIINNEDNIIYGIVTVEDPFVRWYDYNGIVVTGNQLVYENNRWIRVYKSEMATLSIEQTKLIYNVVTIDGIININGVLCRDFLETQDEDINLELLRQLDNYHNK
jgi:hypothetical protein